MQENSFWWQRGCVYQIYPRSFQDSNGDGIGDLPGILQRLDYLQSLNVDAVWISPIYPSPMHDFGYDVADYVDIHPLFGSLEDFKRLLDAVHSRGLKLLLDLVPNHTSDEHAWFVESRSSRDNPKRDWYIWRDAQADGLPPNNWLSFFGGPAWTYDEITGQYYLHQFVRQQPELNYRNPAVLAAMLDVMRFWLDLGVDGFRVDVITMMIKDAALRDNPPNPDWDGVNPVFRLKQRYTRNQPEVHAIVRQMRALVDTYADRVLVGETYQANEMLDFYGENLDECHLPFNFQLIRVAWQADAVRDLVDSYESALPLGAWPNWVLGNHDQRRVATRVGRAQARVATMLLLTLRGTPTIYYGEEIGMHDGEIPPEFIQDPPAVNQPELADSVGRDPERTPMQWDGGPNAGFAEPDVQPWLPLAGDYAACNVGVQDKDTTSMLNFFRALTMLRRREPALSVGDYAALESASDDVFAYTRRAAEGDVYLIVLNFGDAAQRVDLSAAAAEALIVVASDMLRQGRVDLCALTLAANEGLVLRLIT